MSDLSNVKVGDKVIYYVGDDDASAIICKVTRVTDSGNIGISDVTSSLFKPNGYRRGAGIWDRDRLVPYDVELASKIKNAKIIRHAYSLMYNVVTNHHNKLDLETAKKIIEILEDKK